MTQYEKDLDQVIKVNDGLMSIGIYNLLISIRDLKLYKAGIKPHKGWRLKHVKEYFGIIGNADTVLEFLEMYRTELEQSKSNIDLN